MKKIIFTILICTVLCISDSLAQVKKWTIEVTSATKSEIFESTDHRETGYELKTGRRISGPKIEINVRYNFTDYFALESGFSHISYCTNWSYGLKENGLNNYVGKHELYSAIQIPIRAFFQIPISKKIHFFTVCGFALQFPTQQKAPTISFGFTNPYQYFYGDLYYSWYDGFYNLSALAPYNNIHLLINTKMGLSYNFDIGLSLSVFGEYYQGTRTMATIRGEYNNFKRIEYINLNAKSLYITRGNYWSTGLGLSYSFNFKTNNN